MNKNEINALLDSLTPDQRNGIARLILDADIEGDYRWNGDDSVFVEDTQETLEELARVFSTYDPSSAIEQ